MRVLSKSKIMAFRQCPKRLWLDIHHPELRPDPAHSQTSVEAGNQVGAIARKIYDPNTLGTFIDTLTEGLDAALSRTQELLQNNQPVFEAGFCIDGAVAFADVLLPPNHDGRKGWHMVEVKSSTSLKSHHRDDAAVQAYIARNAGLPLERIALAHIDSSWTYTGSGSYNGLLTETDLTEETLARSHEVRSWLADAHAIATQPAEPDIRTGPQCNQPSACEFLDHCRTQEPQAEQPITWLPRVQKKSLRRFVAENPACELRDAPDALLNDVQKRVKTAHLTGQTHFDRQGAASELRAHQLPAYFMDFESIQFAVPIWKGARPYQQRCFQFSVHKLADAGEPTHVEFLDITGNDPSQPFAEALIEACGTEGPVYVYNAGFEQARIKELAARFKSHAAALRAINERVVDLLPIARDHYYHPSQQGSWSIKSVLPALCPDLNYNNLDGVKNGGMAMTAYAEAIKPDTTPERREEIRRQLLAYCKLDTEAMVRLWEVFSGRVPGSEAAAI